METVAVREDCRHYARRSTTGGDRIEQCRLGVNETDPFACPEGCLFFEARRLNEHGWQVGRPGDQDQENRERGRGRPARGD